MKLFGSAAVIACSMAAAFLILRRETEHIKALDGIIRILTLIGSGAGFYARPFGEILLSISGDGDFSEGASRLLSAFSDSLARGSTVTEAWRAAVECKGVPLAPKERQELASFGEDMCRCTIEDVPLCVARAAEALRECRRDAGENRIRQAKTRGVVVISAGFAAVLLLL